MPEDGTPRRADAHRPIPIDVDLPIAPHTLERRHEDLRQRVTLHLTYAIGVIAVLSIVIVAAMPDRAAPLKDLLSIILPGLFGVYGTAMGFYFSQRK